MGVYIKTLSLLSKWLKPRNYGDTISLDSFCQTLITYSNENVCQSQKSSIRIILRKHAFDLLWILGIRETALKFANELISEAQLFGLQRVILDTCRKIVLHRSITSEDDAIYRNLMQNSLQILTLELELELLFCDVVKASKQNKSLIKYFSEMDLLIKKANGLNSYKTAYRIFYIRNIIYSSTGNLQELVDNSLEAYYYFNSLEFDHSGVKILFLRHAIDALIELKQIVKARAVLDQYVDKKSELNSTAKRSLKEMYVSINMAEGDMKKALKIALSIKELPFYSGETELTKKRVDKLIASLKEKVQIYK